MNFYQCTFCIPPSKHRHLQITKEYVAKSSKVANFQIYVEQAIKRMKYYKTLRNELQALVLPLPDNIITVYGTMTDSL